MIDHLLLLFHAGGFDQIYTAATPFRFQGAGSRSIYGLGRCSESKIANGGGEIPTPAVKYRTCVSLKKISRQIKISEGVKTTFEGRGHDG